MHDLNHRHLLVSASISNPPLSPEYFDQWLKELVEKVDMKVLMGPYSTYCEIEGNEGLTGLIVLSTSHSSGHFFMNNGDPYLRFDLYSCANFELETVLEHMKPFGLTEVNYMLVDRNGREAYVIDQGIITY